MAFSGLGSGLWQIFFLLGHKGHICPSFWFWPKFSKPNLPCFEVGCGLLTKKTGWWQTTEIHDGHNGLVWILQKGLIECRCSVRHYISISFHRLSFKKGLWYTILIYISTTRIRQRNFEKARGGKMGMQIDALSICQEWCWRDVYWRKKENYLVLQSKIAHAHFMYWCAHGFKFEIKCQALICHKPPESCNWLQSMVKGTAVASLLTKVNLPNYPESLDLVLMDVCIKFCLLFRTNQNILPT